MASPEEVRTTPGIQTQDSKEHRREGEKIRCDCCGTEVMAVRYPDRIVITDKRHGKRHIAVIPFNSPQSQDG